MKKNYTYIFFCVVSAILISGLAHAQDFHFSQFYNAPILVNPSLTGKCSEDFRLSLIHRNQWKQINSPYTTTALAGDVNFVNLPFAVDKIGVGLYAMNDELGDGIFKNQSAMLSVAAHKAIDPMKRHVVSFGIQGGYLRKNINKGGREFRDQIDNYQMTTRPTTDGVMSGNDFGYVNFNAGASYSFVVNDRFDFYSGISMFNITKPKEQLFFDNKNKLGHRYFITGGARYKLTERLAVLPAVMFMTQSGARILNLGGAMMYHLNNKKDISVMAGAWYRATDATIFLAGMKFKNYHVAVSYDAAVSKIRTMKEAPNINDNVRVGAFEISLTYVGFLKRAIPNDVTIPCRFF